MNEKVLYSAVRVTVPQLYPLISFTYLRTELASVPVKVEKETSL